MKKYVATSTAMAAAVGVKSSMLSTATSASVERAKSSASMRIGTQLHIPPMRIASAASQYRMGPRCETPSTYGSQCPRIMRRPMAEM